MTYEYETRHRRAANTHEPDRGTEHPRGADASGTWPSTAVPMHVPLHVPIPDDSNPDAGVGLGLLPRQLVLAEAVRLVDARMVKYLLELDRVIDSAVQRNMSRMDPDTANAIGGMARVPHYDDARRADAEREVTEALSGIRHVVSAAYVQRENDYWSLFITHDSDRRGDITEQIVDKIVDVENIPSVPLLEPHIMHVSDPSYAPPEATPLFPKR